MFRTSSFTGRMARKHLSSSSASVHTERDEWTLMTCECCAFLKLPCRGEEMKTNYMRISFWNCPRSRERAKQPLVHFPSFFLVFPTLTQYIRTKYERLGKVQWTQHREKFFRGTWRRHPVCVSRRRNKKPILEAMNSSRKVFPTNLNSKLFCEDLN